MQSCGPWPDSKLPATTQIWYDDALSSESKFAAIKAAVRLSQSRQLCIYIILCNTTDGVLNLAWPGVACRSTMVQGWRGVGFWQASGMW
jgi:hypothetical protein